MKDALSECCSPAAAAAVEICFLCDGREVETAAEPIMSYVRVYARRREDAQAGGNGSVPVVRIAYCQLFPPPPPVDRSVQYTIVAVIIGLVSYTTAT